MGRCHDVDCGSAWACRGVAGWWVGSKDSRWPESGESEAELLRRFSGGTNSRGRYLACRGDGKIRDVTGLVLAFCRRSSNLRVMWRFSVDVAMHTERELGREAASAAAEGGCQVEQAVRTQQSETRRPLTM